jgi:hypothetical protein
MTERETNQHLVAAALLLSDSGAVHMQVQTVPAVRTFHTGAEVREEAGN